MFIKIFVWFVLVHFICELIVNVRKDKDLYELFGSVVWGIPAIWFCIKIITMVY